ncbi:unnamed protein product [Somion occarium]|uniref:Uncharacterized protein n=1 Tax=Somion occarium TaxID=3059160 RepID=A0ABP1E321_9APHY
MRLRLITPSCPTIPAFRYSFPQSTHARYNSSVSKSTIILKYCEFRIFQVYGKGGRCALPAQLYESVTGSYASKAAQHGCTLIGQRAARRVGEQWHVHVHRRVKVSILRVRLVSRNPCYRRDVKKRLFPRKIFDRSKNFNDYNVLTLVLQRPETK